MTIRHLKIDPTIASKAAKFNDAVAIIRKLALMLLPDHEMTITQKRTLKEPEDRHYWQKYPFCKSFNGIVKKHVESDTQETYTFTTEGLSETEGKFLQSTICSQMRNKMPLDANGMKRWTTRTDKVNKCIHLKVR